MRVVEPFLAGPAPFSGTIPRCRRTSTRVGRRHPPWRVRPPAQQVRGRGSRGPLWMRPYVCGKMAGVFMDSEGKRRVIRVSVWVAVLSMLLAVFSSLATTLAGPPTLR